MQKYNYLAYYIGLTIEKNKRNIRKLTFLLCLYLFFLVGCTSSPHPDVPVIAFLQGHGEHSETELSHLLDTLSWHFNIDMGTLDDRTDILDPYDVLIISDPRESFNEKEKYIIDQYLMKGRKIIWILDGCRIDTDQLLQTGETVATPIDLNLNDLFFSQGFRINPDLLCQKPDEATLHHFPLSPYLIKYPHTSLQIKGFFFSSITPVGKTDQRSYEVLLKTEEKVQRKDLPFHIDLKTYSDTTHTHNQSQITGIHLRGNFASHYQYRIPPKGIEEKATPLKQSEQGEVIVIACGSFLDPDGDDSNGLYLLQLLQQLTKK